MMKIRKYISNYLAKCFFIIALLFAAGTSNVYAQEDTSDEDTEAASNEVKQFINAFTDWAIISFNTYSGQNEAELGSLFAKLKDQIKNNAELQEFITDISSDIDGFGSTMQAITNKTGLKVYIQPQKVNNNEGFYIGVFNSFLAEGAKDPVAPYVIIKPVISGTKDTGYAVSYTIETSETVETDGYTLTEVSDKNPFNGLSDSGLDQKAMGATLKNGLTAGLSALSETIQSNFLPDLYMQYAGDVVRPGDEIEVPMDASASIELMLLEKGDVPRKTVTWTLNPDGDLAVSTLGMTKDRLVIEMDTVSGEWGVTAATNGESVSINLKIVDFNFDWKHLLKTILYEALQSTLEQTQSKIDSLEAANGSSYSEMGAILATIEKDNYPLEPVNGSELYSVYDEDKTLGVTDSLSFYDNETRAAGFENLRKLKKALFDILKQVNMAAVIDILVEDPSRFEELLDNLVDNSGDLVIDIVTAATDDEQRDGEIKKIVFDYLNSHLEELADAEFAAQHYEEKVPAEALPSEENTDIPALEDPNFYINPLVDFPGFSEFKLELKATLDTMTNPPFVVINYSQDLSKEGFLSRSSAGKPKNIGDRPYLVYTAVNIPGSVKLNGFGQGISFEFDQSEGFGDYVMSSLSNYRSSFIYSLIAEELFFDFNGPSSIPTDLCNSRKFLLSFNKVVELDEALFSRIGKGFEIKNNKLLSFTLEGNSYKPVFTSKKDDNGDYEGLNTTYYFADWDKIKKESENPSSLIKKEIRTDKDGESHTVYLNVFSAGAKYLIKFSPLENCIGEEVLGDNGLCYTVKPSDCESGVQGEDGNLYVTNLLKEDIRQEVLDKLNNLLSGSSKNGITQQNHQIKGRVFLTSEDESQNAQSLEVKEENGIESIYVDGTKENIEENEIVFWLQYNTQGKIRVKKVIAGSTFDKGLENSLKAWDSQLEWKQKSFFEKFLSTSYMAVDSYFTVVYDLMDMLSSGVGKVKIPASVYNCNSNEYNSMYAEVFSYINITSFVQDIIAEQLVKAYPQFNDILQRGTPSQIQFAFFCGMYNGLIDVIKSVPDLAKLLVSPLSSKGRDANGEFISKIEEMEIYQKTADGKPDTLLCGKGLSFNKIWYVLKDGIVAQLDPQKPCVAGEFIGSIAGPIIVMSLGDVAAGAGVVSKVTSTSLKVLQVCDKLTDPFRYAGMAFRLVRTTSGKVFVAVRRGMSNVIEQIADNQFLVRVIINNTELPNLKLSLEEVEILIAAGANGINHIVDGVNQRIVLSGSVGNVGSATLETISKQIFGEVSEQLLKRFTDLGIGNDRLYKVMTALGNNVDNGQKLINILENTSFTDDVYKLKALIDDITGSSDLQGLIKSGDGLWVDSWRVLSDGGVDDLIKRNPEALEIIDKYRNTVDSDLGKLTDKFKNAANKEGALSDVITEVRRKARQSPGTSTGNGIVVEGKWMRGTDANIGLFPKRIADKLKGKQFKDFNEFRSEFWKAIADDPELFNQFGRASKAEMLKGNAPFALQTQQVGGRIKYELHHKTPIHDGGGVYDIDNLVIVTPRYHKEILDPAYHFKR